MNDATNNFVVMDILEKEEIIRTVTKRRKTEEGKCFI